MKVKVPKQFKVGAFDATVHITPFLRSDDAWKACFNQRTGRIELDSELGEQMRDRSFLHELTHMIDLNYGCDLSEDNIDRIACGLYEILHNNLGIELDWSNIKRD